MSDQRHHRHRPEEMHHEKKKSKESKSSRASDQRSSKHHRHEHRHSGLDQSGGYDEMTSRRIQEASCSRDVHQRDRKKESSDEGHGNKHGRSDRRREEEAEKYRHKHRKMERVGDRDKETYRGKDVHVRDMAREDVRPRDKHGRMEGMREQEEEEEEWDRQEMWEFNWEEYRSTLNKIFFRDEDFIVRGTPEYDDFWKFFHRYCKFQMKKSGDQRPARPHHSSPQQKTLGLPDKYDKRYRINFSIKTKDVEEKLKYLRTGSRTNDDEDLTPSRVAEFRLAWLHYIDFCQKQKLQKLAKLRHDQASLPIHQYRDQIVQAVRQHRVVVVAGDTGCGKSTQVPQYLMSAGFTCIACTQPRRIACISLAKRVGYETLNEYGSEVAYQVRFEGSKTDATRILFLTEGLLLRQVTTDPTLSQYSIIVLDEVHERHLNGDFLLGVLRALLRAQEDLKMVLMSATINIKLFAGYFNGAPVIQVPGRLYPIQLEYLPIKQEEQTSKSERLDPRPYLRVMQRIDHKYPGTERGDLLIFLSGMSEITAVVEAGRLYAQQTKRWIVLPLHSTLSIEEQDKVFDIAPEGVRKCIVSTNIAETSITIDGVRFICDSGKVKEMSYDPGAKMQRLQEFWISRASAEQRKGRAGRTGPGVCFRMYDESEYDNFQEYATPEIQRVPLDSTLLQMISMGLRNPRKFPFIEPPAMSSIENSVAFLKEQGALTEEETLTPIGRMLARLPVDVVIGKMLIMGTVFHVIDPVLSIAAALSVQSPFHQSARTNPDAMHARKPLESDHGDPFTLLNAFDEWIQVKAGGRNSSRKWCRRRGLEEQRFYEMVKLKEQFKDLLKDHGLLEGEQDYYYREEERRRRHGERRRLQELKRRHDKGPRKRKVLKLEHEDIELSGGDDDDDDEVDIKDIEFKLKHDLNQLQETSNQTRSFTLRDVLLLKVVLCSGLYPLVAIADDCNTYRRDSEQVFHTKSKQFVVLHPTGVFCSNPEPLQLPHTEGKQGVAQLKGQVSSKHQLLAYTSLLETNKPYLVNTMRIPAVQTLMLYAHCLDTNQDCTRIVSDYWLELTFPESEAAQLLLSSVIQLRVTWAKLLGLRLQESSRRKKDDDDEDDTSRKARKLEKVLARKLTEFLSSDVEYSIRRLGNSEIKNLFVGPLEVGSTANKPVPTLFSGECRPHPTKGGVQINDYLTYNCLQDDGMSVHSFMAHLRNSWTCPTCQVDMAVTLLERLQHQDQCQNKQDVSVDESRQLSGPSSLERLRKPWFCTTCQQEFSFTNTEILKHRRTHAQPAATGEGPTT
ncbi:probable ATP-dependent RNA helicase DHX34 [Branchiostoma floridae]|uniref:RNA helicase n=1 Tax=Branchiostoma floridae TaxID=7739 RepID=A0A9J7MNN4_BRAFL|nr:probable ATP-dependent RNA helicase DHX34 [Branchiostoma floridae]